MDPQQKQKVMIGVVAVLVLGAGSYYFLAGGDGPAQVQTAATNEAPKARVVESTEVKQRNQTRATDTRDAEEAPAERAERVIDENDSGTTRTRRTGGPEKKSKAKNAPAA